MSFFLSKQTILNTLSKESIEFLKITVNNQNSYNKEDLETEQFLSFVPYKFNSINNNNKFTFGKK